jgi:hypothetical protein
MHPDPAIFVIDLQRGRQKIKFFSLLLFEGTFSSFFKEVTIKIFLTTFA